VGSCRSEWEAPCTSQDIIWRERARRGTPLDDPLTRWRFWRVLIVSTLDKKTAVQLWDEATGKGLGTATWVETDEGLVLARREALAWGHADHGHDAHRHSGTTQRESCRLDGKGQRRTVPALTQSRRDQVCPRAILDRCG